MHGQRALIDANFRSDRQRQWFFDAARRWGVPICFIHCQASPEATRVRLQARHADASDADWSIYRRLEASWEPIRPAWLHAVHVLDTAGPIEENKQRLQTILRQEGLIA